MEAIGAVGAAVGTAWAAVSEIAPPIAKAVGSTVVASIGTWGAVKLWKDKRRSDREQRRKDNDGD